MTLTAIVETLLMEQDRVFQCPHEVREVCAGCGSPLRLHARKC